MCNQWDLMIHDNGYFARIIYEQWTRLTNFYNFNTYLILKSKPHHLKPKSNSKNRTTSFIYGLVFPFLIGGYIFIDKKYRGYNVLEE